jgi:post-segregation antitoxin (ccd killing protein)
MAARLNITIPDELHERLQAVKDIQPSLNVSAICQEAIEMMVKLAETRRSAGSKRERAVQRLNLQLRLRQKEWYCKGKEDGLNEAPALNYEDFSVVIELSNTAINPFHMIAVREPFRSVEKSATKLDCPQPMRVAYYAGWMDGVLEFWNDIKDELVVDELALDGTPNGCVAKNFQTLLY